MVKRHSIEKDVYLLWTDERPLDLSQPMKKGDEFSRKKEQMNVASDKSYRSASNASFEWRWILMMHNWVDLLIQHSA